MKILLAEDDAALAAGLQEVLRRAGHEVITAADGAIAVANLTEAELLVTDLRLPGLDGLSLMAEARRQNAKIEIVVMTAYGTIPSAVEAMRRGARQYLLKPFDPEELLLIVREVAEVQDLRRTALRSGRGALVGSSGVMARAYKEIDIAAGSEAPVLILGETGTGKELAARAIHDLSPRRRGPFIAVNLGALPRELVESELFGYEKGAFTGAQAKKRGRFQLAAGGTLFLDEINSLPLDLQPKLLRACETGEVWPLGAEKADRMTARILAAGNIDLDQAVARGEFREDLFYRLNVLRLDLPPLRRHPEDIPQIVQTLLERSPATRPYRTIELTSPALCALMSRPWPGNVRELGNALERALTMAAPEQRSGNDGVVWIDEEHFASGNSRQEKRADEPALPFRQAKARVAEEWSKQAIRNALAATSGNVTRAAKQLQMGRTALIRLINRYNIKQKSN